MSPFCAPGEATDVIVMQSPLLSFMKLGKLKGAKPWYLISTAAPPTHLVPL
jgi:hypothetical protein